MCMKEALFACDPNEKDYLTIRLWKQQSENEYQVYKLYFFIETSKFINQLN